jgi:hypothetical protein
MEVEQIYKISPETILKFFVGLVAGKCLNKVRKKDSRTVVGNHVGLSL